MRADVLVADIGDYYEDDELYVTYMLMERQLRKSSRPILEIKSTYPNCKGGFVGDMATYLTEAEHSWERFKSKR